MSAATDWRVLRAAIRQRDRLCVTLGCGRPINHVDYIVPPSEGGSDDPTNLRGQCHRCHNHRPARRTHGPWLAWGRPITGDEDRGQGEALRPGELRLDSHAHIFFGGRNFGPARILAQKLEFQKFATRPVCRHVDSIDARCSKPNRRLSCKMQY